MSSQSKVQKVQEIYANFGQGNIPAILEELANDVVWIQPGAPDIPYAGVSRNKNEVLQFFQKLADTVNITQFEPRTYIADGDNVAVIGYWKGTMKTSGRPFESNWIMTWQFEGDKVKHYQAAYDTNNLAKALR